MQTVLTLVVLACACAAAPPAQPTGERDYQNSPRIHQLNNMLDYLLENEENYYNNQPQEQKQSQVSANSSPASSPAHIENLDNPDSEVEILPGVQPQQPPQQNPVAPNIPGLVPGQRVYIVHMPLPAYQPGGGVGYHPVYVVAAAPNGNENNANGYQTTLLLEPAGNQYPQGAYPQPGFPQGAPQAVYPQGAYPHGGFLRPGFQGPNQQGSPQAAFPQSQGAQGGNQAAYPQGAVYQGQGGPGYLIGGASPYVFQRPYELVYQNPAFGYQQLGLSRGNAQSPQGQFGFTQQVALQSQQSSQQKESNRLTETREAKNAQLRGNSEHAQTNKS